MQFGSLKTISGGISIGDNLLKAVSGNLVIEVPSGSLFINGETPIVSGSMTLYVGENILNLSGEINGKINSTSGDLVNYTDQVSGDLVMFVNGVSGDIINYVNVTSGDIRSAVTAEMSVVSGDIVTQIGAGYVTSGEVTSYVGGVSGDIRSEVSSEINVVSGDISGMMPRFYRHNQGSPASTWDIIHNLNTDRVVWSTSVGDYYDVDIFSQNQIKIFYNSGTAGFVNVIALP